MEAFPKNPEDFGGFVKRLFLRKWPERKFEIAGPMDLVIDGRHLGLENLWRIARQDPARADQIVESYIDKLMEGDSVGGMSMPFSLVRKRIMPRIQPESIFKHLDREQVAHIPFVNDTVIVFVIDMPHVTVSVTVEQMVRWGVQVDDLERLARENLARYAPELKVRVVETEDGGKAAIVALQDGYDAARLLLDTLHVKLAPQLGGDFFVATPARDMFVAMTCNPPKFVQRISKRIGRDYQRLPYPITSALFLVTRDGVAGTAEEAA
ncbi:MAG: DUF1444 family protein [Planctomycetes bacterium]|nr:DUF1444 family protein [Planctomycetota bacterium]